MYDVDNGRMRRVCLLDWANWDIAHWCIWLKGLADDGMISEEEMWSDGGLKVWDVVCEEIEGVDCKDLYQKKNGGENNRVYKN